MQTIQKIKREISMLPRAELFRFRAWYDDFDNKVWDEQIEEDAKSGKLDKMAEQAITDFRAGKYKEL